MTHEEKFKEMAKSSKAAIEDFNDYSDDQAISWAADRIKSLENILSVILHDHDRSEVNWPAMRKAKELLGI